PLPLQQALQALSPSQQTQLTPLLEALLTALTTSEAQGYRLCRLCEEAVCPSDRCPVEQQCHHFHHP
ncbi:MAG: MarR family transcriptional regulator, partial [Cyanobacteria bacterium]|nr:MarR family transcriptional regulator [Cyanobacteriota bacterium]